MHFSQINKRTTVGVQSVFASRAVKITQIVLIIVIVGLIIWDIYLYGTPDKDDTISGVIRNNAVKDKLFVITWLWGVLSGHLFIARKEASQTVPEPIAILVLLLISTLILLLGNFVPIAIGKITLPLYMHIVFLIFGLVCGYFLWPQKLKNKNQIKVKP